MDMEVTGRTKERCSFAYDVKIYDSIHSSFHFVCPICDHVEFNHYIYMFMEFVLIYEYFIISS